MQMARQLNTFGRKGAMRYSTTAALAAAAAAAVTSMKMQVFGVVKVTQQVNTWKT